MIAENHAEPKPHTWQFTRDIWQTLKANLHERASYLKLLYDQISSGPVVKERYLDIGAAEAVNSMVFGGNFDDIYCVDLKLPKGTTASKREGLDIHYIIADAHKLPFMDNSFDLVSMFSSIEHMQDCELALHEAIRVLKRGGELVIQFPNRYFPLDLHTGLPNPTFLPRFARKPFLHSLGYEWWLNDVYHIPKGEEISHWLGHHAALLGVKRVIYPPKIVPAKIKGLYKLAKQVRLLHLIPLGYLYVYRKVV